MDIYKCPKRQNFQQIQIDFYIFFITYNLNNTIILIKQRKHYSIMNVLIWDFILVLTLNAF
jgi:hypothetical protein